jgi:hypothetical protein
VTKRHVSADFGRTSGFLTSIPNRLKKFFAKFVVGELAGIVVYEPGILEAKKKHVEKAGFRHPRHSTVAGYCESIEIHCRLFER